MLSFLSRKKKNEILEVVKKEEGYDRVRFRGRSLLMYWHCGRPMVVVWGYNFLKEGNQHQCEHHDKLKLRRDGPTMIFCSCLRCSFHDNIIYSDS